MKNKITGIKEYLRDYRFNSILVRSFFLYFIVLLFAFSIVIIAMLNNLFSLTDRQIGSQCLQDLDKTKQRIDNVVQEIRHMSVRLALDKDVSKFMIHNASAIFGRDNVIQVKDRIDSYFSISDYTDSIYVYSYRNDIVVTDNSAMSLDELTDDSWYENLSQRLYEPARIICRLKEERYPYLLTSIQPITLEQSRLLGGVIINIDQTKLKTLAAPDSTGSGDVVLIVDPKGTVIFDTSEQYILKQLSTIDEFKELDFSKDNFLISNGKIYAVTDSDFYGWRYISGKSLEPFYADSRRELLHYYLILIPVALIIALTVSFFISWSNYRPVMNLLKLLRDSRLENADVQEDLGLRRDEMQEIALNIVRNLYTNELMKDDISQYIVLAEKAQISALQAQVSPHFLNNTLENIRWKSYEKFKGDNEIAEIVVNLSKMLRISLDNENPVITLNEEISNAEFYINILRIRFGERMSVSWDIDDNTRELPIIKVCLQPLIENCIQHGLKARRSGGEIRISSKRLESGYELSVSDNGAGMEQNELELLRNSLNDELQLKERHIGVINVNQRLKLLLNRNAQLTIDSRVGEGTTVTITVPLSAE